MRLGVIAETWPGIFSAIVIMILLIKVCLANYCMVSHGAFYLQCVLVLPNSLLLRCLPFSSLRSPCLSNYPRVEL